MFKDEILEYLTSIVNLLSHIACHDIWSIWRWKFGVQNRFDFDILRSYSRVEKCCNCPKFYHIIALALYSAMLPSSLYIGQHYKLPTQCDEKKFIFKRCKTIFSSGEYQPVVRSQKDTTGQCSVVNKETKKDKLILSKYADPAHQAMLVFVWGIKK